MILKMMATTTVVMNDKRATRRWILFLSFILLVGLWDTMIFLDLLKMSNRSITITQRRALPILHNCTAIWTNTKTKENIAETSLFLHDRPMTMKVLTDTAMTDHQVRIPPRRPCALLFFGLTKQFKKLVLPNIRKNILQVGHNHHCDIFAHNYNVTELSNSRNDEEGIIIDPMEIYELTDNVVMDTIEDFESQRNMTHLLQDRFRVHKKHGWSYQSYPNMLRQWHSIERVWKLMGQYEEEMNIQYERIGLFRSDVLYFAPIDISVGDAVVPAFGKMTNDRMFYGLYENAYVWANIRFPSVDCYKPPRPTHGLHSEHFMRRQILPNIPNVTTRYDICFMRVRGTGKIQTGDCSFNYTGPQPWKGYGKRPWLQMQWEQVNDNQTHIGELTTTARSKILWYNNLFSTAVFL